MHTELELMPQRVRATADAGEPLPLATTLSAPYSGSTLFAMLLARHPLLSSDGETFPQCEAGPVACSCGRVQVECPYYRQAAGHMLGAEGRTWNRDLFTSHPVYSRLKVVDSMAGRLWNIAPLQAAQDLLRAKVVPAWRRQDEDFVANHLRFMTNSLRMRQARVYVDGCKSIRRALLFARCDRVQMKVIHLIRDGRGFCFSYLKNNGLPQSRLPQAARAWCKELRAVERFVARYPQMPVLTVRYEDLCRDLPDTLQRVYTFLEVPYDPAMAGGDAPTCHVLGNRMRMAFTGKVEQCLRWRRDFTPPQIAFLNRSLRPTLERYGYAVET